MSGRNAILNKLRTQIGGGDSGARRAAVAARLSQHPDGVIPARGHLEGRKRTALFCQMAEKVSASVQRVRRQESIPRAVADYLRSKNLAPSIRMGADNRLERLPWDKVRSLDVKRGPADPEDEVGVSHAFAGIAETGTLILHSGSDNPTTVNFLPEHHIVIVKASEIAPDLESTFASLRQKFGAGVMPRTVNMITGPSRSGDIEQKLLLGAHGPRALHIIVVDDI
jgi:L-lactate dehydrogenase complex protein LldG